MSNGAKTNQDMYLRRPKMFAEGSKANLSVAKRARWEHASTGSGTRQVHRVVFHFLADMDLQLVRELRNSIKDCSERGLAVAGKWYITALHRTNLTLKVHHELGLPSFISRYHNTNETRLLLVQEPNFPPQHPPARAPLALRLHLQPHHL